jgi:hypothetical protein
MATKKKKGFAAKRRYDLEFADGDPVTDGLEVKATAPTVAESYELGVRREGESTDAYLRRQMAVLAEHVVEWNLVDEDDEPLPITAEALDTVDVYVVRRITDAWFNIGKAIDETSPLDSRSGPVSPGGSTTAPDPRIEASIHAQALQ